MIFHLTSQKEWELALNSGEYAAASLASEGFIHLSSYGQILSVANSFYRKVEQPILLVVDNTKLDEALKWEGKDGLEFPHIYRTIRTNEVLRTIPLTKNLLGEFVTSPELDQAAMAVTLQTERLTLREVQLTDFATIQEYTSDVDLTKYMPFGPNTPDETRAFLTRKFKEQSSNPRANYDFAVIDKQTNEMIGTAGLYIKSVPAQVAFIGYIIKRSAHGKGFATEFTKRLIRYGFEERDMNRIEATCDSENTPSFKVMLKSGMQQEALLRQDGLTKGKKRNTIICSVLKEEYESSLQKK
ncbi:MAG: GNAT family N-acetyltransferase [Pseudobdellovibrio sp.]